MHDCLGILGVGFCFVGILRYFIGMWLLFWPSWMGAELEMEKQGLCPCMGDLV